MDGLDFSFYVQAVILIGFLFGFIYVGRKADEELIEELKEHQNGPPTRSEIEDDRRFKDDN